MLKEKGRVSFKLPDAFFHPEDSVLSGVYFDLLEFQRESVPAVGDHVGPPILKRSMYSHVWGLFLGPWILFFTKTSKNNGIIIALTTRGKQEGREGDRQAEGGREGGRV